MSRVAWVAACAGIVAAVYVRAGAHERITTTVTWDREIAAIVQARCVECHASGGRAPMPLTTYAEARPWARAIKHEVLTRRMPIWRAARGFGDFANDPSLSPFEIALVTAWVDGGAPKALATSAAPPAAAGQSNAAQTEYRPGRAREVTLPCGDQPAPRGRLLGIRPALAKGESMRVTLRLPRGDREILGWFREYDPNFAPTYWLRTPVDLPAGARLSSDASPECRLTLAIAQR